MVVKLIVGNKGSGKTKALVGLVNAAAKSSEGNVVCIEKSQKLTFDIDYKARLIDTDNYFIAGFDALYGFISGLFAGNYDITEVFLDTTLKIGGGGMAELECFVQNLARLAEPTGASITATVSCDKSELPPTLHEYCVDY